MTLRRVITPGSLPGVTRTFGTVEVDRRILTRIGRMIIRELFQARLWPVDTGRSLRGFRFRTVGQQVIVFNNVEYAQYVEENTGAFEDSLRRVIPDIRRLVRRYAAGTSVLTLLARTDREADEDANFFL